MYSTRYFIAAILLLLSGQSQALFMPAEIQLNTDVSDTSNTDNC